MVKHNVGIIIQARMGSTRLEGKILFKLPYRSSVSVLEQIIRRAKATKNADKVVVASSINSENDILENILKDKCLLFRGDEENVLSRFYSIAKENNFETIVRLTADNPCFDPIYIEKAISEHISNNADYTYTKGLPLGMNVEVLSFSALEEAHQNASKKAETEHVTPYITSKPQKYKLHYPQVISKKEEIEKWRLTMDNPTDYSLMCLLYENLYKDNPLFGWKEINTFLSQRPWAVAINQSNFQKQIFTSFEEEKTTAIQLLRQNDLLHTANYLNKL
ncbi:glycosyltransferase family protein [Bernardetia sp.]|uniref:glycosyltransferase family protein n=1 Tax=Bernardetia sp. TaxID=1937974 RepID=UPI0025C3438C|nr:glycosyltransferase family protein [Bernardetia sp.]